MTLFGRSHIKRFLAVVLFCVGATLLGQVRSATISGRVTDTSGAAIPEAKVTVTEETTNQAYESVSNLQGEFAIPYLAAGIYAIRIERAGFSVYTVTGTQLATAQSIRIQAPLQVSAVESTITVSAEAAALQTENSSVTNAISERVVQALPNVNRNPLFYAALQQGVTPRGRFYDSAGPNSFGIGIEGRRQFSAFSVNGGQAFTNDIQLDGVSVQGSAWNEVAVLPNADGIAEVRTNINNFSAEYGRGQSVVTLSTKSGTNEFHGSVFYRHRNDALNANSWGNNARSIARPDFKVHTYGGNFGGPIIANRTFFFASFEGLRFDQGVVFLRTVPTAAERRGDFSKTLAVVNGIPAPLQLFDPFSVTQVNPNAFRRAPIPNSVITRIHPGAQRLFSFYPDPNRTPDDPYLNSNNFARTATRTFDRANLNSRVDHRLGEKHSLYITGGFTNGTINTPNSWADDNPFNSSFEGFARLGSDRNPYGSIGDTWTISPSLLVDVRYGLNRINTKSTTPPEDNFDYSSFGIPADIQAANFLPGVPPNMFINGTGYWSALTSNAYQHKQEHQTNHHFVASATKITGKWSFKAGTEFRNLLSNYTDNQESISYRLNSSFTAGPLVNNTGSLLSPVTADLGGHAFASLLMGAGNLEIGRGFNAKPAFSQKYFAIYTQNDWRPTSRLTLNIGLRWDFQAPVTDRFNNVSSFDFSGTNPYGTPGAFVFPGSGGQNRYLWEPQYRDFGPRAGFAYRMTNNMVIRGGYGLVYLPTNTGYFDGPFTYGMSSFVPFTDAVPYGSDPKGVLAGDFGQVTRVVAPTRDDALAPGLYGNSSPRFDWGNYRTGKSQQWNLFIQRQVRGGWLASVGYVASRGTQLPVNRQPANSNAFLPQDLLQQWRQDYINRNGTGDAGSDQIANPYQPVTGALIPFTGVLGNRTMQRRQTLYPYPHFQGLQMQVTNGFSNYHALQVQASRDFSNGFFLSVHYTWSKMLQFSASEAHNNGFNDGASNGSIDPLNSRVNYMLAQTDIPHRLVATYVYELPFGKGRPLALSNGFLRNALGGWQFGGNVTLQSGTPQQVGGVSSGSINGRNFRLEGVPIEVPKELQKRYDGRTTVTLPSGRQIRPCNLCFLKYSSDAFQGLTVATANGSRQRDVYWYGASSSFWSDFRNPNFYTWNASVHRTFSISEKYQLEFGMNAMNVLNHMVFIGLNSNLGNTEVRSVPSQGILPNYGDNGSFGTWGTGGIDPRQIEMHVKFRF